MKNTILILVLILVVVFVLFSILAQGSDHAAERSFYRVMTTHKQIAANPDVAPPVMLASVENGLTEIIEEYPKSRTAKIAHITLAQFLIRNTKYDLIFDTLGKIS